jgi:hypothetical protein
MTMRPSLVVGLGGTGSWAAAYLKQRLIADQRWVLLGENPEAMATPGYDAHPYPVQLQVVDVDKINRPTVGGVQLDGLTEDLGLDAPVGEAIQHLRNLRPNEESGYRSIESWLPRAEAAKLEVNEAMTFMTSGAGQIRQFGRIAFFLDILDKRQIIGRLGGAIGTLATSNDEQGERGIYIVASVGGGSGAGLLIDTLLYLRDARSRLAGQVSFRTIVFVILSGAFRGVLEADKYSLGQANGYAALRELDRLVNASETISVEWEPGRTVRLDGSVADHVYLLDGSRDLDSGRQLEGYNPPEEVYPVAVADAIYAHLFPSTGKVLARDYPNLSEALISGQPNRYSTFGTYLLQYDWERLMRSSTNKAARDVLNSRLATSTANARDLARQFLTAQAKSTFTADGVYQELPFLLTEVMTSPDAAYGGLDPVSRWLEPASNAAPFLSTPTLRNFFPELKRFTTRYDNQQVVDDTETELARFWGDEFGRWQDGEPQFHPVANVNAERCEKQFTHALYLAVASVMNLNRGIGGVNAAIGFVGEVDRILEAYSDHLDKVRLPGLAGFEETVQRAIEEMQDRSHLDDFKEQKDYLEAAQELVQEQRRDQCLKRSKTLISRFRYVTGQVKAEITGWQQSLEQLATAAEAERIRVDNERVEADGSPLRQMVPLPGSAVEDYLYSDCVGPTEPGAGLPQRLLAAMENRWWGVYAGKDHRLRITWSRQVPATAAAQLPDAEPEPIELRHLTDQLSTVFLPLRSRHIFEILEQQGDRAADLAIEIRNGAARLAAFDQARQLQHTLHNIAIQDWNYVFADWRREGPGAGLSSELKRLLDDAAPANASTPTGDLAALPLADSLPTSDKIIAFTARHLILLDAFRGVGMLVDSYQQRREAIPSPHVLPEEKGAARLEAESEKLAHDGYLAVPLSRIAPEAVPLCVDPLFLQMIATGIANGLITWQEESAIRRTGTWVLRSGEQLIQLGTEADLAELIRRVLVGSDIASRQARDELAKAADATLKEEGARQALARYASDTPSDNHGIGAGLDAVLRVAAAKFLAGRAALS